MAWECLTVEFQLDPERLYVTYFGGDDLKAPGVPPDEETKRIWLKYVPASRILPFDAGDNFWEMGDVGPCVFAASRDAFTPSTRLVSIARCRGSFLVRFRCSTQVARAPRSTTIGLAGEMRRRS